MALADSANPPPDGLLTPPPAGIRTDCRPARVVELFAGVGGFHVALDASGWEVIWANQWEPSTKRAQHAFDVYRERFPHLADGQVSNRDIAEVPSEQIPQHDLLVGGFPCQDYSVAKPLPQATGIRGRKGILWWQIYRIAHAKLPPLILLENVDRLLNSPATHRGRDFAIMLACLDALGYAVEWRVVNAEDYGFPQRRRRVFICAQRGKSLSQTNAWQHLFVEGVLAKALPVIDESDSLALDPGFDLPRHPPLPAVDDTVTFDTAVNKWVYELGEWTRLSTARSPFQSGGVMSGGTVWTRHLTPADISRNRSPAGVQLPRTLGEVVRRTDSVGINYLVPAHQHAEWARQKGAKNTERSRGYRYSEGSMCCPENRDRASRTIITSEGGTSPSRFKHIVAIRPEDALENIILHDGTAVPAESFFEQHRAIYTGPDDGEIWRRLTPEELEELNGFDRGWTNVAVNGSGRMTDTRRAFLMGNALVVGVVRAIGQVLMKDWRG